MKQIRLLDLGDVPAVRSQTVYHAVAHTMAEDRPDTIILVSPRQPYVCIGFHQNLEKEVDLAYCAAHNLPVFRREVGGGAVYLDYGQIFSQWVFQEGHLPARLEKQFELYARPLVETYQALGIEAYLRPINDIHVDGKKIGGTGAAQIGAAQVVVGSLMLDFDKVTMAKVLRVPSEKMRDKIIDSLEQYMTTMREQLDTLPDRDTIKRLYIQKCAEALAAEIVPGEWTAEEETMATRLDQQFGSEPWLYQKGGLRQVGVKIHEDVRVVESAYKAPGGLIRVTARVHEGYLDDLTLSGDFTLLPASAVGALEHGLRGLSADQQILVNRLQELYLSLQIQAPGVTPEDFAQVIVAAVNG
jgi:lipoate-protein ligase A